MVLNHQLNTCEQSVDKINSKRLQLVRILISANVRRRIKVVPQIGKSCSIY